MLLFFFLQQLSYLFIRAYKNRFLLGNSYIVFTCLCYFLFIDILVYFCNISSQQQEQKGQMILF